MAGLLGNIVKKASGNFPVPVGKQVDVDVPLEGQLLGGEIVPRQMTPDLLNTQDFIEGELVGGFPFGKAAIGAGGVGGVGLGLSGLMGEDGESGSEPSIVPAAGAPLTTDTGAEVPINIEALVEGTDMQIQQAGMSPLQLEQDIRSTIPESEQGWFDQMASEFDLITVGLSLLASNNGEDSFAANLGNALMAGRAASHKKKRLDLEDSRMQDKLDRQSRLDELEERRVKALEKDVDTKRLKAENDAIRATANANGISLGTPQQNQLDEVGDLATLITGEDDILQVSGRTANSTDRSIAGKIALAIELEEKKANARGNTLSQDDKIRLVQDGLSPHLKDTSIFGIPTGTAVDRESVQEAARSSAPNAEQAILQRIQELNARAGQ